MRISDHALRGLTKRAKGVPSVNLTYIHHKQTGRSVSVLTDDYTANIREFTRAGWYRTGSGKTDEKPEVPNVAAILPPPTVNIPDAPRTKPRIVHALQKLDGGIWSHLWQFSRAMTAFEHIAIIGDNYAVQPIASVEFRRVQTTDQALTLAETLKPDILIHHHPYSDWCHYTGCPVIWHIHANQGFSAKKAQWCKPVAVIANSAPEKFGDGWCRDDITIISQAVDPAFRPILSIGYIGRIDPDKLPLDFLTKFAERRSPNMRLFIFGECAGHGHQARVREIVAKADNITLLGHVEHERLPLELARLDCMVSLSMHDTANLAALEALACGVPVLSVHNPGLLAHDPGRSAVFVDDYDDMLNQLRGRARTKRNSAAPGVGNYDEYAAEYHDIIDTARGPQAPKRPRVLIVQFWQALGGIQTMVDAHCKELRRYCDVHVLMCEPAPAYEYEGCTVHVEPNWKKSLDVARRIKPDILIHHATAKDYCRYTDCPVVWVIHSDLELDDRAPDWCRPVAVFVNHPVGNPANGWERLPLRPLPIGVDLDLFRPAERKPRETLVCGISGRLGPEKVPPEFLKELMLWGNPENKWEIRFIGTGYKNPYHSTVKKIIGDAPWIKFVGDVRHGDMPAALNECDVLLVPSEIDSASIAMVEGMACGLPIIAHRVGGIPWTAGDGALLCDSYCDMISALELMEEREHREAFAAAALSEAVKRHSGTDHAREYRDVTFEAQRPVCSILMPVFNTRRDWLLECWESIKAQSFRRWDLVIVDDKSAHPDTLAALAEIEQDPRVTVYRQAENGGVGIALNAGLSHCRGEFVVRMDSDDRMLPDRLRMQVAFMREHPEADIVGAHMECLNNSAHKFPIHSAIITEDDALCKNWFMNHPTIIFRRQRFMDVLGGYTETRKGWPEDWFTWVAAFKAGMQLRNMPEVVTLYRVSPGQVTVRGEFQEAIREVNRIVRENIINREKKDNA